MRRRWLRVVVVMILATALASAEDQPETVVAPVKVLMSVEQPAQPPMPNAGMPVPNRPQPTLPGGKLPQYQLGQASRGSLSSEELDDARLRFILALPSRPVLVEAGITIDGRPFRMAREQRIEQILEALKHPAPEPEAVSSETQDAAGASGESPVQSPNAGTDEKPSTPENSADAPDDKSADEGDEGDGEPEAESVTPPTVAAYALPDSAAEYIRRYFAATGYDPTPDEVRWLLANWSDGPVLLRLQDNFQRFRARERPVYDVLDRDRDGTVAADELKLAVQSFTECDLNRNDVVDGAEISRSVNDARHRAAPSSGMGTLIHAIPDEASAPAAYQRLAACYATTTLPRFDDNSNGRFDPEELHTLQSGQPDVTLMVAFNTSDPSKSTISVTTDATARATALDSTVSLSLGGATVMFSAVQGDASDQVSLGAVCDGYPILPEIDPNNDGRFTIRELRGLVENLKRLDRNGDGSLTSDEAQAPVRICVGLGPVVHRELAEIRSAYRERRTPVVNGPDWFVRMDRNRDHDLTRSEFPGTDEHFATLDADGDELISAEEALDFDRKSRPTDSGAAAPETEQPAAPESETETP